MDTVKAPPEVGSKYICITIQDGKTSVEAVGFNGHGCREATASVELALGSVGSRKPKSTPGPKQTIRSK